MSNWFGGSMMGWGWIFPLAAWSMIWTGLALWYAAKRGEKWWFIAFLLIHTAGILEILYLLFVVHLLDNKSSSSRKK